MFGIAVAALILVRSASVAATWIDSRDDLADLRAAIDGVEPGARVLLATGSSGKRTMAPPARRTLPGIGRLTNHLPALLPVERRAFWPLLFADPAQQPVSILPPFDRMSQPLTGAGRLGGAGQRTVLGGNPKVVALPGRLALAFRLCAPDRPKAGISDDREALAAP